MATQCEPPLPQAIIFPPAFTASIITRAASSIFWVLLVSLKKFSSTVTDCCNSVVIMCRLSMIILKGFQVQEFSLYPPANHTTSLSVYSVPDSTGLFPFGFCGYPCNAELH